MTTTTTTTKYELTDADRKRLDVIAQRTSGKPKVDDIAWNIARDWFATLPVVSREAAERALGEATKEECILYHLTETDADYDWTRAGLNAVLARRRAMLDDATAEPPKSEPSGPSREWLAKAADAEDANRSVSVGGLAVDTGMYAAPVEPTPEPQPAIDVVAELAELRKNADRCLATLGAHRSQLDDTIATIGLMLESQDAQRGVNKIHAQRLDTLNLRVTDLEFAVQRKPWWRWW